MFFITASLPKSIAGKGPSGPGALPERTIEPKLLSKAIANSLHQTEAYQNFQQACLPAGKPWMRLILSLVCAAGSADRIQRRPGLRWPSGPGALPESITLPKLISKAIANSLFVDVRPPLWGYSLAMRTKIFSKHGLRLILSSVCAAESADRIQRRPGLRGQAARERYLRELLNQNYFPKPSLTRWSLHQTEAYQIFQQARAAPYSIFGLCGC